MPPHSWPDLVGLYQIAVAAVAMTLFGRLVLRGRGGLGAQLVVGWGALCILLTVWGVATAASLRIPAIGFALAALAGLAAPRDGGGRDDLRAALRMLAVALPILAITATLRPSQPDIFLNLMPNAAYLYDHAAFPMASGPPSYSFLPVAPYNTQFVSFLGTLAGGGFAANGLALFTIALHLAAGLLFARVVAGSHKPGWQATALGLLLATLLDPGFVPRVSFAGYGEAPLAITLLFAGWFAAQAMAELADGVRRPAPLLALALALAAMVNTKQQAVGLFIALVCAAALVAACDRRIGWRRALAAFAAAALPAAGLYLLWRYYVLAWFPDGELKPSPIADWHWTSLPEILGSMMGVIGEKPFLFVAMAAAVVLLARRVRRGVTDTTTRVLALSVIVAVLYNGFLVLSYIGHFQGQEHSYFRYNTHLSMLVVLGLTLAARDALVDRPALVARYRRLAGGAALAVILIAPVAFAGRLRFDRDAPQPLVWDLAKKLAPLLKPDDRIALLLPGDNGSLGEMLRGALRYTAPRRLALDVREVDSATPADLAAAAAAGYRLALLSCTDGATLRLPPHAAALLAWSGDGWSPVAVWPYPPVPPHRRWTRTVAAEPLCLQ